MAAYGEILMAAVTLKRGLRPLDLMPPVVEGWLRPQFRSGGPKFDNLASRM